MTQTVEVRFKGTRKAYFLWRRDEPLRVDDAVIVEAERGRDLGRVTAVGDLAEKKCGGRCTGCAVGGARPTEPEPPKQVVAPRHAPTSSSSTTRSAARRKTRGGRSCSGCGRTTWS